MLQGISKGIRCPPNKYTKKLISSRAFLCRFLWFYYYDGSHFLSQAKILPKFRPPPHAWVDTDLGKSPIRPTLTNKNSLHHGTFGGRCLLSSPPSQMDRMCPFLKAEFTTRVLSLGNFASRVWGPMWVFIVALCKKIPHEGYVSKPTKVNTTEISLVIYIQNNMRSKYKGDVDDGHITFIYYTIWSWEPNKKKLFNIFSILFLLRQVLYQVIVKVWFSEII